LNHAFPEYSGFKWPPRVATPEDKLLVSDSPYRGGQLVLHPVAGILAGLLGSAAMLGLIAASESYTGLSLTAFLKLIGGDRTAETMVGFLAVGSVLGLLYSLCEQSGPTRALLAVGLFYGFFLWILSSWLLGLFLSAAVRSAFRSVPFLSACMVYGFILALAAALSARRRPSETAVPKD
jgi:hypothetical protein